MGGWSTPSSFTISVPSNAPPVIVEQPTDQTVLLGGAAEFSVVATGTDPLNFQWYFNGGAITGATNAAYMIASAQVLDAGTYFVIVSSGFGNVTSRNAMLTVMAPKFNPLSRVGDKISLSWNVVPGIVLQSAESVIGPWKDEPAATGLAMWTVSPTNAAAFFRLILR